MICVRAIQSLRCRGFASISMRFAQLDQFARERYGKRVIHLAVRWVLDRYDSGVALWGARRPDQLTAINEVLGWHIDARSMAEIDRILAHNIKDPVGPEFMAPPRALAA
jgi:aryl-alcohol dehydrogenase-like predicted oxidoreductase